MKNLSLSIAISLITQVSFAGLVENWQQILNAPETKTLLAELEVKKGSILGIHKDLDLLIPGTTCYIITYEIQNKVSEQDVCINPKPNY